ncbi:MAG: hypothetical protein WD267_14215 [Balneolales bacterium]
MFNYLRHLIALLIVVCSASVLIAQENSNSNLYNAKIQFNEEVINLSGKSTYAKFPLMYSFYLEKSGTIACGIHVMYLEEDIEEGVVYTIGTKTNPQTGVTCVRKDDAISEKILSTSGEFVIEKVENGFISGSYDIHMVGGITKIIYKLKGDFTSDIMK